MSTGKFPEMSPYTFHEQMQETADKSGCLDEYDNGMRRLSLLSEVCCSTTEVNVMFLL
jgi:hypothetical protein